MAQNLVDRALHLAAIAGTQQGVHEDVVGFKHGVGLELAAPIAVGVLLAEQPIAGSFDSRAHRLDAEVDSPKARLRGSFAGTRLFHS